MNKILITLGGIIFTLMVILILGQHYKLKMKEVDLQYACEQWYKKDVECKELQKLVNKYQTHLKEKQFIYDKIPNSVHHSEKIVIVDALHKTLVEYPISDTFEKSVTLALSFMHVESSFMSFAKSKVGAIGLMQVMDIAVVEVDTFRVTEGKEVYKRAWNGLKNPYYNIQIGVTYFYYLKEVYYKNEKKYPNLSENDRHVRAIVAYNFGSSHKAVYKKPIAKLQEFKYYKKISNAFVRFYGVN